MRKSRLARWDPTDAALARNAISTLCRPDRLGAVAVV